MTNPEPRRTPSWLIPIVAGVVALGVGVGGYLVANPFAAPRVVEPETVSALVLPAVDAVTPIGQTATADGAEIARSATLIRLGDAGADLRATIAAALADADAEATGSIADESSEVPVDTSGITVLDPCPEAGDSGADCPTGSRATVLALTDLPDLHLWFTSRAEACGTRNTTTSVAFRVLTNVPAVITLRYEVGGSTRTLELEYSAAELAEWEADAEDGESGLLGHCVELRDLTEGWEGVVVVTAVADDGTIVIREPRFAADPALVVPPSWVRPVTRTSFLVSIPTTDISAVRFRAIVAPFGQPTPSCDFGEDVPGAIEPLEVVMERVSGDDLEARGFIRSFIERHTAAFVVPEASTVTVCAGWVDRNTWSGVLPDHVYSEVFYSPDLALPVVSVDGFEPAPGVRASIELTGAIGGSDNFACGFWRAGDGDGGEPFCGYARFDGRLGWDAALVVTAEGTGFGSTSTRTYALPIAPEICGLGCELPETRYVDVPVFSRDPCIGDCPDSYLGTIRLRVDWEHGTRSWFGDWLREDAGAPESDAPRMDTGATPRLTTEAGADGTQFGVVEIVTDEPTTVRLGVGRLSEAFEPVVVDVREDTVLRSTHEITFGPLQAGAVYHAFTVELTDADGNNVSYSALPGAGRTWANGILRTDPPEIPMRVELSITAPDGGAVRVGTTELLVQGGRWFERRDLYYEAWCTPGPIPFTDDESVVFGYDPASAFSLTIGLTVPEGPVGAAGECILRGAFPVQRFGGMIPLPDLLTGTTVTVTNEDGYTATIRLTPIG